MRVVICDSCNEPAMSDWSWAKNEEGQEQLSCRCGSANFTLLSLDDALIPEGALVIEEEVSDGD